MFIPQSSHKIVILSGAPLTDLSRDTALGRGVEGPRGRLSHSCRLHLSTTETQIGLGESELTSIGTHARRRGTGRRHKHRAGYLWFFITLLSCERRICDQAGLSLREKRICYGSKASSVAFGVSWTKPSLNLPELEQASRNRGAIPPRQTRFFHRFLFTKICPRNFRPSPHTSNCRGR